MANLHPWGRSIRLTTAHTRYNLLTLVKAVDATFQSSKVAHARITFDLFGGGKKIFIGNSAVSDGSNLVDASATEDWMDKLIAGGFWDSGMFTGHNFTIGDRNYVDLSDVYLMSDTDAALLGVQISV